MTPLRLHRFEIPLNEAIEALLGDQVGDCERWEIYIVGASVIIDVVEPAPSGPVDALPAPDAATEPATPESAPAAPEQATPPPLPAENERKGGPLARKAALMCAERGFWTFADFSNAEEAAEWLRTECGVTSRADLDHDEGPARRFRDVERRYKLWLDGYDV
jgi:hypothetical protein